MTIAWSANRLLAARIGDSASTSNDSTASVALPPRQLVIGASQPAPRTSRNWLHTQLPAPGFGCSTNGVPRTPPRVLLQSRPRRRRDMSSGVVGGLDREHAEVEAADGPIREF